MTEKAKSFTPREIVSELDRYIVGQTAAKRAVAIALRNRWRRQQVSSDLREEIYPKIGNMPFVNKLIGAPFVPITPLFPLFGLAGLIPLPSKWRIEYLEPIDLSGYGPEAAEDRTLVFEISEQVRDRVQQGVYDNLVKRGSAFV